MPRKTITIYDGDDFERLGELQAEVRRAELRAGDDSGPRRMGDDEPDAVAEAKAAFDEFVDVAADRAESWVLESIGHEAWRDLVTAHPARTVTEGEGAEAKEVTHPDDDGWGVNTETFGKALLLFVDPEDDEHRTVTKIGDAELSTLPKRLRRLSQGQFDTLWVTAHALNTGAVNDPKALRYSTAPRSTES